MLAPGTLVDRRYRIVRRLKCGGMGCVYEARDERLKYTVALKQLVLSESAAQKAFEREAKMLAPLHHAILPNVFDHFRDPAGLFLVMKYIPGEDLGEQLETRKQPFPLEQVLHWADQLLDGLDYLHGEGIVHRDIKPQNVKLTSRGEVILLDFGIAKDTTTGSVMAATPGFAPLEQMQGTGTDARSDLYALAATMYALLTASNLESSVSRVVAESRRQPDPLRPLHVVNPQVPRPISNVVMKALALHADQRPASAAAMRKMLRDASPPDQPPPPPPAGKKSPGIPTVGLVGVLIVLVLLAAVGWSGLFGQGGIASRPIPLATATEEAEPTATPEPPTATTTPPPTSTPEPPTATAAPASPAVVEIAPGITMEFVEVPAGPFLMGSSDADDLADDDEKPQHELELPTYWIGKTEVTNAQFRPFVEGDGYSNPEYWTEAGWQWREANDITQPFWWDDATWNGDQQPVVGISWYEAVAYARWLSAQTGRDYRLPTEAEWEKAARGPEGLIYPWGNQAPTEELANFNRNVGRTTPVGSYPDGASPYGALDMAGNVWEWCVTKWRKDYPYQLEEEWTEN